MVIGLGCEPPSRRFATAKNCATLWP